MPKSNIYLRIKFNGLRRCGRNTIKQVTIKPLPNRVKFESPIIYHRHRVRPDVWSLSKGYEQNPIQYHWINRNH